MPEYAASWTKTLLRLCDAMSVVRPPDRLAFFVADSAAEARDQAMAHMSKFFPGDLQPSHIHIEELIEFKPV